MQHRSPIIFWLLLAATIAVDAVVLSLAEANQNATIGYLGVALHALILWQLGIVCIWSALNPAPNIGTKIAPLVAVVLVSLVDGLYMQLPEHYRDLTTFMSCLGFFGLYAVLLLAALWFLQRTSFWRRKTGSTRTWQFSMFHVLTMMTIVAVLVTVMRNNPFFGDDVSSTMVYTLSYVALAVASVIFWSLSWNWFLRLASVLGVSALLGFVGFVIFSRQFGFFHLEVFNILHAYYLIQAIMFSLWLGLGPILPPRIAANE